MPLVFEAHGGAWGSVARLVGKTVVREHAARLGIPGSAAAAELQQRTALTLQRENARSVLRRRPAAGGGGPSPRAAAWEAPPDVCEAVPADISTARAAPPWAEGMAG